MSIHLAEANKGLTLIYDGSELIGQVRKGIDGKWYPELPPSIKHDHAVRNLVLAHRALDEFMLA